MPVTKRGRWYNAPVTHESAALPAAARTASGQSSAFDTEDTLAFEVALAITAISGAGATVTVTLQTSFDGTVWDDVTSFPAKTATGSHTKVAGPLGPQCRYSWVISGTSPSITFGVSGKARR